MISLTLFLFFQPAEIGLWNIEKVELVYAGFVSIGIFYDLCTSDLNVSSKGRSDQT